MKKIIIREKKQKEKKTVYKGIKDAENEKKREKYEENTKKKQKQTRKYDEK